MAFESTSAVSSLRLYRRRIITGSGAVFFIWNWARLDFKCDILAMQVWKGQRHHSRWLWSKRHWSCSIVAPFLKAASKWMKRKPFDTVFSVEPFTWRRYKWEKGEETTGEKNSHLKTHPIQSLYTHSCTQTHMLIYTHTPLKVQL